MVAEQKPKPRDPRELQQTVQELQHAVEEMEAERERLVRQKRRQLLLLGVALSLLVHVSIMIMLGVIHRESRGRGHEPVSMSLEFAVLPDEELTQLQSAEYDDLVTEAIDDIEQFLDDDATAELVAEGPTVTLEMSDSGAIPTLGTGGAGADSAPGLSGGAAGTSFFGIASQGSRFAYIVDRSGSMGEGRKMPTAMRELARSIQTLPDYAHFYVVLFSSDFITPPMQRDWMRSRKGTVRVVIRWLNDVTPQGGTHPKGSFQQVFALEPLPDVIFFLTDGEIPDMTADFVAALNTRGKRAVINTIAFGDPSSQDLLKAIADESGGAYRYVPSD